MFHCFLSQSKETDAIFSLSIPLSSSFIRNRMRTEMDWSTKKNTSFIYLREGFLYYQCLKLTTLFNDVHYIFLS